MTSTTECPNPSDGLVLAPLAHVELVPWDVQNRDQVIGLDLADGLGQTTTICRVVEFSSLGLEVGLGDEHGGILRMRWKWALAGPGPCPS